LGHIVDSNQSELDLTVQFWSFKFLKYGRNKDLVIYNVEYSIYGKNVCCLMLDECLMNNQQLLIAAFRPVGMPHTERVTVHNLDSQGSLHLLSLSGSTSHFHCSFFLEKVRQKFVDIVAICPRSCVTSVMLI